MSFCGLRQYNQRLRLNAEVAIKHKPNRRLGSALGLGFSKRTPFAFVFAAEVRARFPKLGKEFFVQRLLQISDALRTARARLGTHHALNHLDVVRTPEREVFVVLDQRFGQLKLFVKLFHVRENFDQRALPLAIVRPTFFGVPGSVNRRSIESMTAKQRKESLRQRRRIHPSLQPLVGKIVAGELAQDSRVFQAGREFNLAKLH